MLCCYHGQIITQKQVKLAVLNKEFQSHSYHIVLLGYIGRYGNCQGQTSTVTAPKPDMGNDLCLLFLRLQLPVQATARGGGDSELLVPKVSGLRWKLNTLHSCQGRQKTRLLICILCLGPVKEGFFWHVAFCQSQYNWHCLPLLPSAADKSYISPTPVFLKSWVMIPKGTSGRFPGSCELFVLSMVLPPTPGVLVASTLPVL